MNKDEFLSQYKDAINSTSEWSNELVSNCMGNTLDEIFNIHKRLQSTHEITMSELEWILSDLPIQLIYIAENLSKLQLSLETVKIVKSKNEMQSSNELKARGIKAAEIKEIVQEQFIDDKIGIVVYESAISQIEKYISLSKELIMGAKKIWQRRISTEEVNPVSPVKDLPSYNNNGGNIS